jgi:methionyl-tRNA formyltransferase
VAYLGTPDLAVPPLQALVDDGVDVALVVSQPDRRRGRGSDLLPSPVKAAALALGLPVTDRVDDVLDADVPLGVVVAFGRLIKPHVLEAVPMINLHFSLLPRWRGAAPLERAILAGDEVTGVDLMAVEEGLDTGGTYRRTEVPVGPDDTLEELRARLVEEGNRLLVSALRGGIGHAAPQVGEPTYAAKLTAEDRHLDWSGSAVDVHRCVRLGDAWTTHNGKRLKVWRTHVPASGDGPTARAADGDVELVEVQPEGRGRMEAKAWANGARFHSGDPLGT